MDVLEYIHENEYVHGDIKAANLLLGYRNPERVSTVLRFAFSKDPKVSSWDIQKTNA